ncbi:hypothetical protein Kisp02_54010 [Kineosporia sp. NBRC 101731]|nr:hypothetical protein Kisp02_54010 [Kineosporia sp. NBRC 101731]
MSLPAPEPPEYDDFDDDLDDSYTDDDGADLAYEGMGYDG